MLGRDTEARILDSVAKIGVGQGCRRLITSMALCSHKVFRPYYRSFGCNLSAEVFNIVILEHLPPPATVLGALVSVGLEDMLDHTILFNSPTQRSRSTLSPRNNLQQHQLEGIGCSIDHHLSSVMSKFAATRIHASISYMYSFPVSPHIMNRS
jgi:hypothetical protein